MAFLASCGHSLGDDFGWPGEDGRTICYPCFEDQADASWWEMVSALAAIESAGDDHLEEVLGSDEQKGAS